MQNNLIQIQSQLQSTSGEIHAAKRQAHVVQEGANAKISEVEQTLERISDVLESSGREGHSHTQQIQEDISKLREVIAGLSEDFYDNKRLTQQVQSNLARQVSVLEESKRRTQGVIQQDGSKTALDSGVRMAKERFVPERR